MYVQNWISALAIFVGLPRRPETKINSTLLIGNFTACSDPQSPLGQNTQACESLPMGEHQAVGFLNPNNTESAGDGV